MCSLKYFDTTIQNSSLHDNLIIHVNVNCLDERGNGSTDENKTNE